jgi:hypothetical protein
VYVCTRVYTRREIELKEERGVSNGKLKPPANGN